VIPSSQTSRLETCTGSIPARSARRAGVEWLIIALLTAALTALSTHQSLRRYHELRSGWSWDLAYYNQWFWALTQGDGKITVRPVSAYAQEGPSIWKMNYLAPIRLALVPFYALFPDPRTLLVLQNIWFWLAVPVAYGLLRSESESKNAAMSAAFLIPLTPLCWPLVWNDFRELQLSAPFVLCAVWGVRNRSTRLAAPGIAGMLACRQEFALMVGTFALLPSRQAEPLGVTLRWRRATVLIGLCWMLFAFFGYLKLMVDPGAPNAYINQFLGPKASLGETLQTSLEALVLGMGAWAALACLVPRVAIVAVPWIWSLCSGRWAMRFLASADWHHTRYAVPMVVLVLAAGLLGYARLATWLLSRKHGRTWLAVVCTGAALFSLLGLRDTTGRMATIRATIDRAEAADIWTWIRQVAPEDAVLADYEVSAPLSSRRWLFSYVLDANLPPGFPQLGPEFHWLLIRNDFPLLKPLLDQGFETVHRGPYLTIAHRGTATLAKKSEFLRFCANMIRR
jgi:uncharacterized membrane protein